MEVGVAGEGAAGACGGLSGTLTESVGGGHPVQLRTTKSRDREGKGERSGAGLGPVYNTALAAVSSAECLKWAKGTHANHPTQ